ncbi:hypothetical protein QJS10_CPA02g00238 [Acorus calamus]|uniref:Glycine-rich protein n=1 Tax=Acorus calamus TaxID=4465 RepID=A0AAV9FGT3_ACOCL|nr:hypothetical protein QJS10_CPA02g00238 [Acorus calamus]
MGRTMLMFKSLALMVVQRHTAASKPAKPCMTGQHVDLALLPMIRCTSPPSRSTHDPSFSVSIGQVAGGGGDGGMEGGGDGVGDGGMEGGGGGGDGGMEGGGDGGGDGGREGGGGGEDGGM